MPVYETVDYNTIGKAVKVLGVSSWYDSRMEFIDNQSAGRKVYEMPEV